MHSTSEKNHTKPEDKSQERPKFNWPKLRKAIEFYERERLCYLPAPWGRKNPSLDEWKEFETRLPTMAEKADWFKEGKPANIGVVCGGVSRGLVILCFNDQGGAGEFFGEERWQKLPKATFITKTLRGHHVWLRSDSPIKSQKVGKNKNESWLEIRSDGNFTVVPPSLHPSGVFYQAIGVDSIYKPDDLVGFITQRLAELGLTARGTGEALKERAKPSAKEKPERSNEFNALAIEKLLESCAFIQHCQDDAKSLSEPLWWSMCDIFSFFGEPGRGKAHELSEPYPKYTRKETDKKLEYAKEAVDKSVGPHTCVYIEKDLGFACPEDCLAKKWGLKSPVVLANRLARTAGLPIIIVTNRFLREKTADTIAAVEQANQPPKIFERSGNIVRIAHDEFNAPYIETLTESACRGFLERAAAYVRISDKGGPVPLPAPPLDIVRDFMSLPNRNLPALLNVTEIPILRSDGTIVTEPGYDQASRLYYEPATGLMMPAVPNNPSEKELEAAIALIQEPLIDFPFDSEASKTHALAVLITPVCRPMIVGLAPLCLLDKPQPGTGAGLLSDVIAIVATGRNALMMAPPRTDEECEKRLASILLHGQAIVTIDNIEGYLYFPSLAMLLTATTFQTRILGQTKEVRLPNRGTYIVTGNNVKLGGDMPRRCYLSRMDAREARPWMRDPKSFKYQHLIQWVKENRGELLAAILTMARAWIVAGKPIPEGLPPLGGFEDWIDTIGGILTYAGFTDFLGNLEFMYQQADVETPQWEGFLAAWQEEFGEEPTTVETVVNVLKENDILSGVLPDRISRDPKKLNRSLANALRHRADVRYPNGLMVTKNENLVHHAVAWQVINYRQNPEKGGVRGVSTKKLFSYKSDRKGELGELASQARTLCLKTPDKKEEEEIYKNGLEPNSPNSLLATGQIQKPNSPFSNDLWEGMPDYPKEPCHACGGSEFWPDFKNKRFVCSRCHPRPQEIDMEV